MRAEPPGCFAGSHALSHLLPGPTAHTSGPPPPNPHPPQMDMNYMAKEGGEDVYGTFNMLMRRKVG